MRNYKTSKKYLNAPMKVRTARRDRSSGRSIMRYLNDNRQAYRAPRVPTRKDYTPKRVARNPYTGNTSYTSRQSGSNTYNYKRIAKLLYEV